MNKLLKSNLLIIFLLFIIVVSLSVFYPFTAIQYISTEDKFNVNNIIQLEKTNL